MPKGATKDELALLEDILSKLTVFHAKTPAKAGGGAGGVSLPDVKLPNLGIKPEQVGG